MQIALAVFAILGIALMLVMIIGWFELRRRDLVFIEPDEPAMDKTRDVIVPKPRPTAELDQQEAAVRDVFGTIRSSTVEPSKTAPPWLVRCWNCDIMWTQKEEPIQFIECRNCGRVSHGFESIRVERAKAETIIDFMTRTKERTLQHSTPDTQHPTPR